MSTDTQMRRLYHFTAADQIHLGGIQLAGEITTAVSFVSFLADGKTGPFVAWLTDDPEPSRQEWACGPYKQTIRIAVDVPIHEAHHWPSWSREHGIDELTYRALAVSGGDPRRWWLVRRAISHREFISITHIAADGTEMVYEGERLRGVFGHLPELAEPATCQGGQR
jgi:hypothetical protein